MQRLKCEVKNDAKVNLMQRSKLMGSKIVAKVKMDAEVKIDLK